MAAESNGGNELEQEMATKVVYLFFNGQANVFHAKQKTSSRIYLEDQHCQRKSTCSHFGRQQQHFSPL